MNKQFINDALDELHEYRNHAHEIQEAFAKLEDDLSVSSPIEAVRVHGKNILRLALRSVLDQYTKEYERRLRDRAASELKHVKDRIEKLYT